jgi:hypothetical protein
MNAKAEMSGGMNPARMWELKSERTDTEKYLYFISGTVSFLFRGLLLQIQSTVKSHRSSTNHHTSPLLGFTIPAGDSGFSPLLIERARSWRDGGMRKRSKEGGWGRA